MASHIKLTVKVTVFYSQLIKVQISTTVKCYRDYLLKSLNLGLNQALFWTGYFLKTVFLEIRHKTGKTTMDNVY